MLSRFLPEGRRLETPENRAACASLEGLRSAGAQGTILEGQALSCSPEHHLTVSLGPFTGVIPREEAALGVAEGTVRDIAILSRVGKPVCFLVEEVREGPEGPSIRLSRRRAQVLAREALMAQLRPGMVIPCTVTHLEPFGAFVDMGCGLVSMIGIEHISVSRIPHPACRFSVGQEIFAAVLDTDPAAGRVRLTHRELLGTWAENARRLSPGMTAVGWVRGIKDYGAFVELFPNLSGLAEPREDLREGDRVSVFLKAILPERMKIKLLVIDRLPPEPGPPPLTYFITGGRLAHWRYAPEGCRHTGAETEFL